MSKMFSKQKSINCRDLHKGGNHTTAIAESNLHSNADATLSTAANIVPIPHNHDRNHRVSAPNQYKAALGSVNTHAPAAANKIPIYCAAGTEVEIKRI
jgi:hypothetical protein